jgi:ABC-type nitrate/sulfonate/bicarbonate transport system permease component
LVATQTIPIPVIAPVLVLMFGYGLAPKLIVIGVTIFFPIVVNTAEGLRSTPTLLRDFIKSLGGSRLAVARYAEFPSAMPFIFAGLRVSASYVVIAAVIGEWVSGQSGLGSLMLRSSLAFQTEEVFGSVLLMILVGIGVFLSVVAAQRLVMPWYRGGKGRV